jgi:AcrR family transcriptional regulator
VDDVELPRRLARGEGHRLRDELLRATAELLDESGDEAAVSIRAVARRVGRSTPLVYEHFADREELVHLAARHALDQMAVEADAQADGIDDVDERLRVRAHAYVRFAVEHPEPYRLLFMDRRYAGRLDVDDLLDTSGLRGVMRDLEDARAQGLLAPGSDVRLVALQLWAALHGAASLLLTHPAAAWPDGFVDGVLDRLRDGLAPR